MYVERAPHYCFILRKQSLEMWHVFHRFITSLHLRASHWQSSRLKFSHGRHVRMTDSINLRSTIVEWCGVINMVHENQSLLKTKFDRHDCSNRPAINIIQYGKQANKTGAHATHQNTNGGGRNLLGDTENWPQRRELQSIAEQVDSTLKRELVPSGAHIRSACSPKSNRSRSRSWLPTLFRKNDCQQLYRDDPAQC